MRPTLLLPFALAACAAPASNAGTPRAALAAEHLPPYMRIAYEPFTASTVIAVALREWRAFGSLVYDDMPGNDPPRDLRPDKQPGLWQRVGDYWWMGQDEGAPEAAWTSVYNQNGTPYAGPAPAWSAAFISYVMRVAGAGGRFTYSPLHADYINAAARNQGVLEARRPETYPPVPGDMICLGRLSARNMRFDDLPTGRFFGHCDIVVEAVPGQLTVIGGNVEGSVTEKHVPTTPEGTLAGPSGIVDTRYPWFVVLHVRYDGAPSS